jgi:capsular exopolysaccharide synthesis family protein
MRPRRADEITGNEAFRVVRTNLELVLLNLKPATIMVTSAHAGEGKTAICAQLARSFAEAGRRVVALDLDLREPDLHNWFETDNVPGATDVLTERCRLEEAVRYIEVESMSGTSTHALNVLSAGTPVPNPTELLGTGRMGRLLEALVRQADVVLIDTPPVLPVADTLVIARRVGGALLVVDDDTPLESARAVKDALTRNQANVLGVVLNRFRHRGVGYGYGDPLAAEE